MCASVMNIFNSSYTLYSEQAALYALLLINRMHRARVFIFYMANYIRIFLLSGFRILVVKIIIIILHIIMSITL